VRVLRASPASLVVAAGLLVGGCGIGASTNIVTFPPASVGPVATVSIAVAQTRAAIAAALGPYSLQLADADRPFRPAESTRLASAPRAVYQVVLPADPNGGYIVVYEFRDAGAAVDAGNEIAEYLGSGAGRIQFPLDAQHTIRQLGTTLIFYTWAPSTSLDPGGSGQIAEALKSLGIGFAPPR
jgi:hypothetical protein